MLVQIAYSCEFGLPIEPLCPIHFRVSALVQAIQVRLRTASRARKWVGCRVVGVGCLVAGLLVTGGCGREAVRTYTAPKESAASADPHAGLGGLGGGSMAPELRWSLPTGWEEFPPKQMRVGNFAVKGDGGATAEISIIPLPGAAGGDVENVNRWRGQVGLAAVSPEEVAKSAEKASVAGEAAQLFDLAGTPAGSSNVVRMLAAIQHRQGTAWFFKMLGDDKLVASQKETFRKFLADIRFDTAAAAVAPAPPAPAAPANTASAPTEAGTPKWTPPAGWKEQAPGSMQTAKFAAGEGAEAVEITVSMLAGNGGGLLANVNRWRGQLGMSPVAEGELGKCTSPMEIGDGLAVVADMAPEPPTKRMVAVVVARSGRTWFYKAAGSGVAVEKRKAEFLEFVRGVKYDG